MPWTCDHRCCRLLSIPHVRKSLTGTDSPLGENRGMPANVPPSVPATQAIAETRAWVERAVIGLNLCPFAKAVQAKGQVRYVASDATDTDTLVAQLCEEMSRLATTPA